MTNGKTSAERLWEKLEASGFKTAPPDHPIYSEGPSVVLIPHSINRLKQEPPAAMDRVNDEESRSGDDSGIVDGCEGECGIDDVDDGELCPICNVLNRWGYVEVCEHNLGVIIDSSTIDSRCLNNIWTNWSELCRREVHLTPQEVLLAWTKHLGVSEVAVKTWLKNADDGHENMDTDEFVYLCASTFGCRQGSITQTNGMLSGSSCCLYFPDPSAVDEMDATLKKIVDDLN